MAEILLTVTTGKSLTGQPLRVDILAIDEDTDQPILDVKLTAEQWWNLCTGHALVIENGSQVQLTDARIQRLRNLCVYETMPAGHLRRRVLAILDDKGWGKT